MKYKTPITLTILLLKFVFLRAQNTPIDSIPFILKNDSRIYTYCKINETDSIFLLIDTGASDMVVNSEGLTKIKMNFDTTINNLQTTGIIPVLKSSYNTLYWGKQKIENLSFISSANKQKKSYDGILGLSVLSKFCIKIDYNSHYIILFDKKSYKNNKKKKVKFKYKHLVPFINITIETKDCKLHKLLMEVDTGSDRIIDISTNYVNNKNLLNIYTKPFAYSTINESKTPTDIIYNVFFNKVNISEFELYKIPGGLAQIQDGMMNSKGVDGIIGNWFLKRFNITFDFKNNYLTLEPNNYIHSNFYKFLLK